MLLGKRLISMIYLCYLMEEMERRSRLVSILATLCCKHILGGW